jgi:phosphodiesterase/alkaline phosphatase D-like protein
MTDTTYAGPEQMQWLKQQLERFSNAVFKIIVHGGTIRRAGSQSWFERSKLERRELLDWIASQNIVRWLLSMLYTCHCRSF